MLRTSLLLLSFCALSLSCGGDDDEGSAPPPSPSPDAGTPAITGEFQLTAPPATSVRTGSSTSLDVTLTRNGGFSTAVQLEVVDLGEGVTAELVQPEAGTSGKVTLSASAAAKTGERVVKVRASGGGIAREASVTLMVAGKPGEVDTSFGTAGVVAKTGGSDVPVAIATASDGRLYVLLLSASPTLVRYTADGQLDTTFGTGGKKTFVIGTNAVNTGTASHLMPLPDGAILVAGSGSGLACVTKLDANGAKTSAFGTNGDACVPSATTDAFDRLEVLADGSIVAVGARNAGTIDARDLFVAKFSADGKPDNQFGAKGVVGLTRTGAQYASDLLVDTKGRLLVKFKDVGVDSIWRVIGAGYTDLSFDDDGFAAAPKAEGGSYGASAFVGPADAAIVLGSIGLGALDADGKPLAGFGTAGWLPLRVGKENLFRGVYDDGKILAAGASYLPGAATPQTYVARIDPVTRAFDAAFGDAGGKLLPLDAQAWDLTLQPYRAVILGWYGPTGAYSLVRVWR